MTTLGFVKALLTAGAIAAASVAAEIDFSHTITLGSLILGVLVLIGAGIITIRSQVASVWRQEAEGQREKADRLEAELREKIGAYGQLQKDHEAKIGQLLAEQQELRHALKDELAGCRAQLKVEEAKHDLGAIVDRMNTLHHEAMEALQSAQGEAVTSVAAAIVELGNKVESGQHELRTGQQETLGLLTEIRDSLAGKS